MLKKIDWEYWNLWRIICALWLTAVAAGFLWVVGYALVTNEVSTFGADGIKPRTGLALFGGMLFTMFAMFSMAGPDDGQP